MAHFGSLYGRATTDISTRNLAVSRFISRTYGWMFVGLIVTALTSTTVASSESILSLLTEYRFLFYGVMIAEFGLVMGLSAMMSRLSATAATLGFLTYSALNGVTLSLIFTIYTLPSVGQVFLIAAAMFGGLALFGTGTRRDLTGVGTFFGMGVWGLILVGIVNIFVQSDALSLGMSAAGVLIFAGLTAYDAQKIRAMAYQYAGNGHSGAEVSKGAIFGALMLYLNFINLFLSLLRILGARRD